MKFLTWRTMSIGEKNNAYGEDSFRTRFSDVYSYFAKSVNSVFYIVGKTNYLGESIINLSGKHIISISSR